MAIVVVGSGPCGLTFTHTLLNLGVSVTMVDIGNNSESYPIKNRILKLRENKNYMYDFNEFNQLQILFKKNWYTSKSKLGFSTVWGGTWIENGYNTDDIQYSTFIDNLIKSTGGRLLQADQTLPNHICSCLEENFDVQFRNSSKRDLQVYRTPLALSQNSFKSIQNIETPEDLPWDANNLFELCCKFSNFTYIDNFCVDNITLNVNDSKIISNNGQEINFNYLALAAGPVINARILTKSKLSNNLVLHDTKMMFIPFIKFKKANSHEKYFSLSLYSTDLEINHINYHLQFYFDILSNIDRILNFAPKVFKTFIKLILQTLKKRFGMILVYMDSKVSDKAVFDLVNNQVRIRSKKADIKLGKINLILGSIPFFLKIKLLPIWLFSYSTKCGDSYHMGELKEILMDEMGVLQNFGNIRVLGSSAFRKLYPRPVTKSAMIQSHRSALNLYSQLNEKS